MKIILQNQSCDRVSEMGFKKCPVWMLKFVLKTPKTARKLNNDAREHELHSIRQGLSNNSTGLLLYFE